MSDTNKQTSSVGLQHVRVPCATQNGCIDVPAGTAVATVTPGCKSRGPTR